MHYTDCNDLDTAKAAFETALAKLGNTNLADHYRGCVSWEDPAEGAMWLMSGINIGPADTIEPTRQAAMALLTYHNHLVVHALRGGDSEK